MISRRAEQAAADSLQLTQRDIEQHRTQLNEMLAYREEYRAALRCASAEPMNGSRAREMRAFIDQMDAVVNGLSAKIRQMEQRRDMARDKWRHEQQRANAIDDVAGRALKRERRAEENRTQREVDERAARKSQS